MGAQRFQAELERRGEGVRIEVDRDDEPREVTVPAELDAALAQDSEARAAIERLPRHAALRAWLESS